MRTNIILIGMLLTLTLVPSVAALNADVEACQSGESVLQCAVRETDEFGDGVRDEVDDYCDAIVGGCPLFAIAEFPAKTTDAATLAAVQEACQDGESVVQCASRETRELVYGVRDEVIDFCDAIVGNCRNIIYIEAIDLDGFASLNTATFLSAAAACEEGETVVQCATRETFELVYGLRDEVYDYCDALIGNCPLAYLFELEWSATTTAASACQDGESVAECAARETKEFYYGVRDEAYEFCDAIVGNCTPRDVEFVALSI